jgi:ketosteroid isomerase-like protein
MFAMRASVVVLLVITVLACRRDTDPFVPETIISLERGALERWGKGDPDGYLSIMAPEITYFDPTVAMRIDGREKLKPVLEVVRGRLSIQQAKMINPAVMRDGNVAVLTFNLISRGASLNGSPRRDVKWNSTEVYRQIDGNWKIVHSHWSYTTPPLAQP